MRPALIAVLALLAGCAGGPPTRYYTLSSETPAGGETPAGRPGATAVTLATLRLPAVTDREQMVVRTGPQTVDIRDTDRWAAPLDEMVPRILARDLALRGAAAPGTAATRVSVAIDEFMADTSGVCRLTGRWWLANDESGSGPGGHGFALTRPLAGTGGPAVAAAMSALLADLAGEL
jgi:uncharacterized lipoprotein YmbA